MATSDVAFLCIRNLNAGPDGDGRQKFDFSVLAASHDGQTADSCIVTVVDSNSLVSFVQ